MKILRKEIMVHKERKYAESLLLIEAVQKYPQIYENSHPDYKKNKDEIWNSIVEELLREGLELSPVKCVERWIALRNRFSKERSKLRKLSSDSASSHAVPSWPLYHHLLFLDDCVVRRRTTLNNNNKNGPVEVEEDVGDEVILDHTTGNLYQELETMDTPSHRNRQIDDDFLKVALRKVADAVDKDISPDSFDKDIKSFCDSLYFELVKIPVNSRLKCKIDIMNVCMRHQNNQ